MPLCPVVAFEAGRFHFPARPDPTAARFPAGCICPEGGLRRIRSARELLRELAAARQAIVVVEHAAAFCDEDGAVRRNLSHQLRALSGSAAVAGRAGRSAVLVRAGLPGAFGRRPPPGRTMLTGT